jgi:hypothetical protein
MCRLEMSKGKKHYQIVHHAICINKNGAAAVLAVAPVARVTLPPLAVDLPVQEPPGYIWNDLASFSNSSHLEKAQHYALTLPALLELYWRNPFRYNLSFPLK